MIGLCTGMLLADDGHEVTIIERDPQAPPDPADAWDDWPRRGVNQFRLAHLFLSRFRVVAEVELPRLAAALTGAGACRYNIVANVPDEMKGGSRPDDQRFELISGRRAFVEAVASRTAEETTNLSVRRGAAVEGLVTGTPARNGVPHISGVNLAGGEQVTADLVIDACGRRSPLPRWLDGVGARPLVEEADDSGFVYYGRHFKSDDGSLPVMFGPLKQDVGSIGVLTLPADNGTWSVTLTASSEDAALRRLSHADKWEAVVRSLPLVAHWIDAEPIDDGVAVMAKIADRIRDLAPGGQPVATGVVTVGDSWSCTNPSLGRGASVGILHAVALRDHLRQQSQDDPLIAAAGWADITRREVEPWYRTTVRYDRHRLDEIKAVMAGRPHHCDDPEWVLQKHLDAGALDGMDSLRTNLEIAMVLRLPQQVMAAAGFDGESLAGPLPDAPVPGPDRQQLLALVS